MSHAAESQRRDIKTSASQRKLSRSFSCSENSSVVVSSGVVGCGTSLNGSSNQRHLVIQNHRQHQAHQHHPQSNQSNHQSNCISSNHIQQMKFASSPKSAHTVTAPAAREMDSFETELQHTNGCALMANNINSNSITNNNINGITNNNNIIINSTSNSISTPNKTRGRVHNNAKNGTSHQQSGDTVLSGGGGKRHGRREPLTIDEYETKFRQSANDLVLIERIFAGSMACNQLRAALWPYLFGLILHRGRFERVSGSDGAESYVFIEHEANFSRWKELKDLYEVYQAQWESILPDQEQRFTTFKERKSHIERDVVRCDRLHPFYAEQPQNLNKLTHLLMTYMMYDFDIGYVQGMSDIAAPILCMYQGDLVKTFWVFVEVMKLFRRNFELTQKTILFQLNWLYKLIKRTDPVFAQYLRENDSSNCFFAFRTIVCQFKRELMKEDEDDYSNVLFLWDTIWCVDRRRAIQEEMSELVGVNGYQTTKNTTTTQTMTANGTTKISTKMLNGHADHPRMQPTHHTKQPTHNNNNPTGNPYAMSIDINQANSTRDKLTETEIFVLALCLSMIRRERDIIMAQQLDGTDIHLHFINPKLAQDLNGFIEHAISIYLHLKNDIDLNKLTSPKHKQHHHTLLHEQHSDTDSIANASPISTDGYDLLSDFLIIGGTSGSCMQIIGG